MNSIGEILRLTTFGESHGPAIGGILDGVPSGYLIDPEKIQLALDRRRPGGEAMGSRRAETDQVQLLSGIFEGKTLGTPIGFIIPNKDARSHDYEMLKDTYRPNHADYTYEMKYGLRDYRGGGRASARETACRVCAGAIAEQILRSHNIHIGAYTARIGEIKCNDLEHINQESVYSSAVRCPLPEVSERMTAYLKEIQASRDSVGGEVACTITGLPVGLGEPVFGKLQARLAAAMMSIPAVKGFEYGDGFAASQMRGSQCIDSFLPGDNILIGGNHSGGIQGGISNGNPVNMRIAFKPTPTIMQPLQTVNREGKAIVLEMKGRHDPCVVPRAVPVVQAMAALTVLDALMMSNACKL